ncbi:hypothetical protein SFRURICE_020764, partial [Spodoptera frugiperda]
IYWQIKLLSLEPWALILARAVAGIPCSSCYIVLPIYLKEISDIDLRGALGSLLILNRNIGYLMSYIGADVLSVNTMLWLGLLVPTVIFFIFLAMPETPEYLVKQGKVDEAKTVLAWLRGVSVVDRGVEQDIESIVRVDKQTQADEQSVWKIIWQDKPTFKAFIITIIIKITQQFDGYLIVLIYAGFVFERASESISLKLSPNKQVMLIGVVQLLGSIIATCIVEKTGRKAYQLRCKEIFLKIWETTVSSLTANRILLNANPPLTSVTGDHHGVQCVKKLFYTKLLLVTTSFAVGVGMVVLSAWFYMTSSGFWLPGWLPVLAMCLCIFADAAGFQPISYIIITDLFTFQLRGNVSAFANVCAKLSNFVQTKWFTIICEMIGIHWTFLFFAAICFIACFYTIIYFPETRGKTIDEIYSKLSGKAKKDDSKIESE